jgi:hypothetical protein
VVDGRDMLCSTSSARAGSQPGSYACKVRVQEQDCVFEQSSSIGPVASGY